jgi:hypothetical protein
MRTLLVALGVALLIPICVAQDDERPDLQALYKQHQWFELRNVVLHPAKVLLKETTGSSKFFDGNLGMDLLTQGRKTTIDFRWMTLTSNKIASHPRLATLFSCVSQDFEKFFSDTVTFYTFVRLKV